MRSILAIVNVLGALLSMFAAYFALPAITAIVYDEPQQLVVFSVSAGLTLATGLVLMFTTRRHRSELKPRDGYLLVSLGWLSVATAGALPFIIGAPGASVTDAFFESVSGLTTTGSTVFTGLDSLPHSANLWRHAMHWLGGMGIIVLAVAILPMLGVGGMQMYRAEAPGPVKDAKLTPRITERAKAVWFVYAGFTAVCAVLLWAVGMTPFDAICHAFSALALGGFSTWDASVGHFDSLGIELVLMFFMLLAAINFSTHFLAFRRGDTSVYRRDPEARWVIIWILASIVLLTVVVTAAGTFGGLAETLRHVAFSTISVATTTGFVTEDFSLWPIFAPMWMMFLSCVICSTGSTGGGIKLFRALILIKTFFREMFLLVHPQAVAPLKIAGQVVGSRIAYSVLAFIFVYFMTTVVLVFALLATGMEFISAFAATIASINNLGPGLGEVGPATNYQSLSDLQTWICTLAMFLGRIELFTFLVLFSRTYWRK